VYGRLLLKIPWILATGSGLPRRPAGLQPSRPPARWRPVFGPAHCTPSRAAGCRDDGLGQSRQHGSACNVRARRRAATVPVASTAATARRAVLPALAQAVVSTASEAICFYGGEGTGTFLKKENENLKILLSNFLLRDHERR
jgi:hypothetical protein